MNKLKILFIVHDASRSGAPFVLLTLLQSLKDNGNISFDILLLRDGPLRESFEALAGTYTVKEPYKYALKNKVRRRLSPELAEEYKIEEIVERYSGNGYDIIFGNTIVTLPYLLQFKKSTNTKCVCAIHELTFTIEFYLTREYVMQELPKVDLVLAGSHAVANNLVSNFSIPAALVQVVHAFIETKHTITNNKEKLAAELNIKPGQLVIGCMAGVELRKGTDLLVPLAINLKKRYPGVPFKFVWVGGLATHNYIKIFKQDIAKAGLENNVVFVENTPYPDDYFNLYDIFLLLSREDPFPLVLLSAAHMHKAIIAFEKSGGAPELLSDGAGFLCPYLDVDAMADTIAMLYKDRSLIQSAGAKAHNKVVQQFNANVIPDRVLALLNDLVD